MNIRMLELIEYINNKHWHFYNHEVLVMQNNLCEHGLLKKRTFNIFYIKIFILRFADFFQGVIEKISAYQMSRVVKNKDMRQIFLTPTILQ